MGVDTRITLSPGTDFGNVAKVAAILLGAKPRLGPLSGTDSVFCQVEGLKTEGINKIPGCANIFITPEHGPEQHLFYHFEFGQKGERGICPRARADNIALGVRLVEFFGGEVDFSDSDESECDFKDDGLPFCNADDGEEWDKLQKAMFELRPITTAEAMQYDEHAAYKLDGHWK